MIGRQKAESVPKRTTVTAPPARITRGWIAFMNSLSTRVAGCDGSAEKVELKSSAEFFAPSSHWICAEGNAALGIGDDDHIKPQKTSDSTKSTGMTTRSVLTSDRSETPVSSLTGNDCPAPP